VSNKPTKLLSFARTSGRGTVSLPAETQEVAPAPEPVAGSATIPPPESKKKSRVATNLRFTRVQWRRVRELALDEETSVQELAIRGLSRLLEERGLPGL
jgi:hypothetical protein